MMNFNRIRTNGFYSNILFVVFVLFCFNGCNVCHSTSPTRFSREVISTSKAPEAIGPYSQAIKCGNMLFVSGQVGINPDSGKLVEGGIESETRQAIHNLRFILEAAEFSFADVVQVQIFLADISEYKQMNKVYASFFQDSPPARATIQATRIPKDALVEISLIAVKIP